ncbi:integral membrane sensor signal transduction histidine kinase [[Clostridium] saccharolyticum WM1]|uniref:histidine kinase n=2 Tax=Lacrimispora TaxID=2719231 RepID=D9R492_LACSW|nr:histidine kinase [Lacrimispora saccharolytica]ADL04962.1 integral membrane sensor signal transduction histidine kinase [[Clostridium] saccharolyticum WM1]
MKNSDFHLSSPKMNRQLRLMLILETIVLLGAYIMITGTYQNLERHKTDEAIRQLNGNLMTNIQHTANALDTLSKSLISSDTYEVSPSLWSYLKSPARQKENPGRVDGLFIEKYYQLTILFPQLNCLFLYRPEGNLMTFKYNDQKYHLLKELPESNWVTVLKENRGALSFVTQKEAEDLGYQVNNQLLFAGRVLNNISASKPVAIILAGINISDLQYDFKCNKLFDSQQFACFDINKKLLFSSDGFEAIPWEDIQSPKAGDPYAYYLISNDNHTLFSVIATDKKDITQSSSFLRPVFLVIILVIFLSNLLLSWMITKRVIKSYGEMTKQVYQKSLAEKDLNLQMLRSQINPHFLYNTLDRMRMASLNANYPYLATMCELLAKILRFGVSESNKLVTVEEEHAHLEEYIRLIRISYPNVSISTSLDPEILSFRMLKLLLQPLVENSINHGIIDDAANGSIQIWGYEKDSNLIFTVSDNGNGMDEEHLALLRDYLEDKNTAFHSIGLKNIKKRIQLYYGKEYDLFIDSRLHQGTTVTIKIPVIKESIV